MILEKQKDGWWVFSHGGASAASDDSDLGAVRAFYCRNQIRIDEPLADEIYALMAANRTCSNCGQDECREQTIGRDCAPDAWGCSEWTRSNS